MIFKKVLWYLFFIAALASFYISGKYIYLLYEGGYFANLISSTKEKSYIYITDTKAKENESIFEQKDYEENVQTDSTKKLKKEESELLEKERIFSYIREFFLSNPNYLKKVIENSFPNFETNSHVQKNE